MSNKLIVYSALAENQRNTLINLYQNTGQYALNEADGAFRYWHDKKGNLIGKYIYTFCYETYVDNYNFIFIYYYMFNNHKIKVSALKWSAEPIKNNDSGNNEPLFS